MSTRSRRAFITGVYGQDGTYLAEHLLACGYEVLGLLSPYDVNHPNAELFRGKEHFSTLTADLRDTQQILSSLESFAPHEVYCIAAVSDLKTAREQPEFTYEVNFTAFQKLTEALVRVLPQVRIFQALSSRVLMPDESGVIRESSRLSVPQNMYDQSKRDAYEKIILPYRKEGYFIVGGFLCNHESPRRGERFVTGKIARAVSDIYCSDRISFSVGNINALRDWSHAKDIVRAMHAMLVADKPRDYVIGSGTLHSVRDFINQAFSVIGENLSWKGEGIDVFAIDEEGVVRVIVDPLFYLRDDNPVVSDISAIRRDVGWVPEVSFSALVQEMVEAEIKKRGGLLS